MDGRRGVGIGLGHDVHVEGGLPLLEAEDRVEGLGDVRPLAVFRGQHVDEAGVDLRRELPLVEEKDALLPLDVLEPVGESQELFLVHDAETRQPFEERAVMHQLLLEGPLIRGIDWGGGQGIDECRAACFRAGVSRPDVGGHHAGQVSHLREDGPGLGIADLDVAPEQADDLGVGFFPPDEPEELAPHPVGFHRRDEGQVVAGEEHGLDEIVQGLDDLRVIIAEFEEEEEMPGRPGREFLRFLPPLDDRLLDEIEGLDLLALAVFVELEIVQRQIVDEDVALEDADGDLDVDDRRLVPDVLRKDRPARADGRAERQEKKRGFLHVSRRCSRGGG